SEPTSCSIASTSRGSLPLLFSLFFLSRIRPPPTSTLFPYTTLFRSVLEADLEVENGIVTFVQAQQRADDLRKSVDEAWLALQVRSEEHTSELQSLRHLVCRLLLEKKKKEYETLRQETIKRVFSEDVV